MLPKDYAQLLCEVLENKPDKQQSQILDRFKTLLKQNKATSLAGAIEKEFEKIQKQKEREEITYISSAVTLSKNQKRELESIFSGPREFSENPSLLGGIAVRQKDTICNATLKKKIELLRASR
ncbi:MAG: F0F1 ATP synthase subunit delta [Candidatus Spechtbacteria bacterium]|nr:F0F1 ATP synthase subunit delta [Candidatus Spechtbacteria bacterium]